MKWKLSIRQIMRPTKKQENKVLNFLNEHYKKTDKIDKWFVEENINYVIREVEHPLFIEDIEEIIEKWKKS